MTDLQSHCTSYACSISLSSCSFCYAGDQSGLIPMVKAFNERHDYAQNKLNQIPGFTCLKADGSFYLFPCVKEAMSNLKMANDIEFTDFI